MIALLVQLALGAPTPQERLVAQELAAAVVREALGGAPVAVPDGYTIARESASIRLAGPDGEVLIVRRAAVAPLVLQTPHPRSDLYTGELVERLFEAGFGQAVLTTTASRADLDVAHDAGALYQSLHVGLLDALHGPVVAQVHGFANSRAPVEAVIGAGLASVPEGWVTGFAVAAGATVATGEAVPALAGRTNVQGWATLGHGTFVHLELSRTLRDRVRDDPERLAAIGAFLQALAAPQHAPVGVTWSLPQPAGPAVVGVGEAVLSPTPIPGARPGPDGWILPGEEVRRTLYLPEGHRRIAGGTASAAWEAWTLRAGRALRRGRPLPEPPWDEGLAARVRARAAGVGHPGAARFGVWFEASRARGAAGAHPVGPRGDITLDADSPWVSEVAVGEHLRLWVRRVDGQPGPRRVALEARWRGRVLARREAFVGPDATLAFELSIPEGVDRVEIVADAPMAGQAQRVRHRPPVGWRSGARRAGGAERALITGDVDAAVAAYRAQVTLPGPPGDWARARLAWLTDDAAVLDAVLARPADTADGAAALADAIVRRRDLAGRADAAARVDEAPAVDARALAAWRDLASEAGGAAGVGALRASGPQGLLGRAGELSVVARGLAEHTRLRIVAPEQVPPGPPVLAESAPGMRVQLVRAGAAAQVLAPPVARPDRLPAVLVRASGPARFTLDGASYAPPAAAEVPIAVRPGRVALEVLEGAVALAPGYVVEGGESAWLLYHPQAPAFVVPTPPGPGAVELRVLGPRPVLVAQSTGRVGSHGPGDRGWVDAGAVALTVHGDGQAALALRTVGGRPQADAPDAPVDLETRLARIAGATRRIDAGEDEARLERAVDLAALSLRELALRDLDAAAAAGLGERAAQAADHLPGRLTGARPGPVDPAAAEVLLGGGPRDADGWVAAADEGAPTWVVEAAVRALTDLGAPERAVDLALRSGAPDLVAEVAARVAWRPIPALDISGGLVAVRVGPTARPSTVVGRVKEALLGLPWPSDEGLIVREGAVQVQHDGPVALALFCRDEGLLGRPCRVTTVRDDERVTLDIEDGVTVTVDAPGGGRVTPIAVAGEERALAIRATTDGRPIPVATTRAASVVEGRAQVAVARGLVHVEALSGRVGVRAGAHRVEVEAGASAVLPALDVEGTTVLLEGSGTVLLRHGLPRPPRAAAPEPSTPLVLPDRPPPVPWTPPQRPQTAPLQGSSGTFVLGAEVGRQQIYGPREPWDRGHLSADWYLRRTAFVRLGAWARGPNVAGGAVASVGTTWTRGWGVVEGRLGASDGPAGGAASARARVAVRQDLGREPIVRLRAAAWTGSWSDPPLARVDPAAWTSWSARGPVGAVASASVLLRGWSNLAGEAGVDVDTRRFGYRDLPLSAFAMGALALSPRTVWSGQIAALPGADAPVRGRTRIEHGGWSRGRTRFTSVWAQVSPALVPRWWEARVGVRVLLSPSRGFADLPPDALWFPTLRTGG